MLVISILRQFFVSSQHEWSRASLCWIWQSRWPFELTLLYPGPLSPPCRGRPPTCPPARRIVASSFRSVEKEGQRAPQHRWNGECRGIGML